MTIDGMTVTVSYRIALALVFDDWDAVTQVEARQIEAFLEEQEMVGGWFTSPCPEFEGWSRCEITGESDSCLDIQHHYNTEPSSCSSSPEGQVVGFEFPADQKIHVTEVRYVHSG